MEYTGNLYERFVKREASDEVDITVVLKTHKPLLWGDPKVLVEDVAEAGYALFKARDDSKPLRYANSEGYIDPVRLRNGWFCSLFARAVNAFNRHANSDVSLTVRYHGPAVQVDITEEETNALLFLVSKLKLVNTLSQNRVAQFAILTPASSGGSRLNFMKRNCCSAWIKMTMAADTSS